MRPETAELIEELNAAKVFQGGGDLPSDVCVVEKESEAIKLANSRRWSEFLGRVESGAILGVLQERMEQRGLSLVHLIDRIRPRLSPFYTKFNISRFGAFGEMPMHSMVMNGVIECELSTLLPPAFFLDRLLPIYLNGHFPCGWTGDLPARDWRPTGPESVPEGQILVYPIRDVTVTDQIV